MISDKVKGRIKDNIEFSQFADIDVLDSQSQPVARIQFGIDNSNHSSLQIDAFSIVLSFGRGNSIFRNYYWDKKGISNPPNNFDFMDISGKETGTFGLRTVLPYYVYFPNREKLPLYISGTIKFKTDVGYVEKDFSARGDLEREDLWNRSTAQDRLLESFSPGEMYSQD